MKPLFGHPVSKYRLRPCRTRVEDHKLDGVSVTDRTKVHDHELGGESVTGRTTVHDHKPGGESGTGRTRVYDPKPARETVCARRRYKQMRSQLQHQRRAAVRLALVTVVLLVCWLPNMIVWPLNAIAPSVMPANHWLARVATWMGHACSSLNPFIYTFTDLKVRETLKKIVKLRYCFPNLS